MVATVSYQDTLLHGTCTYTQGMPPERIDLSLFHNGKVAETQLGCQCIQPDELNWF